MRISATIDELREMTEEEIRKIEINCEITELLHFPHIPESVAEAAEASRTLENIKQLRAEA
jgi:hypothetical protein